MFERFTDRARRVAVLAQEEARMLNPNYIGTEHILLGLIHEGEGVAARLGGDTLRGLDAPINPIRPACLTRERVGPRLQRSGPSTSKGMDGTACAPRPGGDLLRLLGLTAGRQRWLRASLGSASGVRRRGSRADQLRVGLLP